MDARLVKMSKKVSKALRHDPAAFGLSMDNRGWVQVSELCRALGVSRRDLDMVASENDKQRFEFDAHGLRIRGEGLRPMERQHVHLSDAPEKVRRGRPVLITVRAGAMATEGHVFLLSANGVWLASEVPVEFIDWAAVGPPLVGGNSGRYKHPELPPPADG